MPAIEFKKPFLEVTDQEWNKVIAVNLFGSYLVSQVAARQMVNQGEGGKLIFISSVHEDIPFPEYTAYCASKGTALPHWAAAEPPNSCRLDLSTGDCLRRCVRIAREHLRNRMKQWT